MGVEGAVEAGHWPGPAKIHIMTKGEKMSVQSTAANPTITTVESLGLERMGSRGVISFTCWGLVGAALNVVANEFPDGHQRLRVPQWAEVPLGDYRPDLINQNFAPLALIENGSDENANGITASFIGFQRAPRGLANVVRDRGGHDAFLGGVV